MKRFDVESPEIQERLVAQNPAAPNTCFDTVPWNLVFEDLFEAIMDVIEPLHPYHGMGYARPIFSIHTHLFFVGPAKACIFINRIGNALFDQIDIKLPWIIGKSTFLLNDMNFRKEQGSFTYNNTCF